MSQPIHAMSAPSHTRQAAPAAGRPDPSAPLRSDLSALYALSQTSRHVFASPVGPFAAGASEAFLPRFVFFGPHASDDAWRLAFLAGFDHRDLRASRALVALTSLLAADSAKGHALNLTFFPLVDVVGLVTGASERDLSEAPWGADGPPEITLLAGDARQRRYHGFVRLETAVPGEDAIVLRVRGAFAGAAAPDLELITTEETRSLPVRFESGEASIPADGPLGIAERLPVAPFELTLRIPGSWTDEAYQHAAVTVLRRFLRRYRAFQAYGQHL
jgi:hypothetical protein